MFKWFCAIFSLGAPHKFYSAAYRMHFYGSKITLDSLTIFIHVYSRKPPLGAPVLPETSGNFN